MLHILPTKVILFFDFEHASKIDRQLAINQTESNMISLVVLTINNFFMSARFSSKHRVPVFLFEQI